MVTIYHNNRCSKSREGLGIIERSGKDFQVREYLKSPLNEAEITSLLKKLKMEPLELIRKNEKLWKENYKGKDFNSQELIKILADNPGLMERPIVEVGEKAVIGRPPAHIEGLFKRI